MHNGNNNSVNSNRPLSILHAAAGVFACGLALSGCHGQDAVQGVADVVDKRAEKLAEGDLKSINGTYGANCDERSGSWSLEVEIGAPLDHASLSVLLNDSDCVLTLTELRTDTQTLVASPSIALALAFPATPSEFAEDGQPLAAYGTASINTTTFAADFVVTVLYSDDPSLLTDDNTADWEVAEASVTDSAVPAPDYMIDVSGLAVLTDVDDVVVSASGNAVLTAGLVTGDFYVVVDAAGLDTYEEIDTAYLAGTPVAMAANIPASAFSLVGDDLSTPQQRTLIIANIEDDIAAYQRFEISFHPAI